MKITLKLTSYLRKYALPEFNDATGIIELKNDTSIIELLNLLKIPIQDDLLIFVNNEMYSFKDTLKDEDIVSILPPLMGG